MALIQLNVYSHVLEENVVFHVLLPQVHYLDKIGSEPLKVLYLLHGMGDGGTSWLRYTSLERQVDGENLAVVLPHVGLSWYTDTYKGGNYFTYVSEELPALVRQFFPRISEKREDTFVAGLSMGGYGAMKLALSKPERYSKVCSLSGALDAAELPKHLAEKHIEAVFGGPDKITGTENDLFWLTDKIIEEGSFCPSVYMWCGTEDFLYQSNIKMRDYLEQRNFPLLYEEAPGDHQWEYWDAQIPAMLRFFRE